MAQIAVTDKEVRHHVTSTPAPAARFNPLEIAELRCARRDLFMPWTPAQVADWEPKIAGVLEWWVPTAARLLGVFLTGLRGWCCARPAYKSTSSCDAAEIACETLK